MAPKSMASNRLAWLKAKGCTKSQAAKSLLLEFPSLSKSRRCQLLTACYSEPPNRQEPTHETAMCIASFLIRVDACSLGTNVKRVALSSIPLYHTCSMLRNLLRPALQVLRQSYQWQTQIGQHVISFLLNSPAQGPRRRDQRRAAIISPIYCASEGWRSILIDFMDNLYFQDLLNQTNGLAFLNAWNNFRQGRWNARLIRLDWNYISTDSDFWLWPMFTFQKKGSYFDLRSPFVLSTSPLFQFDFLYIDSFFVKP